MKINGPQVLIEKGKKMRLVWPRLLWFGFVFTFPQGGNELIKGRGLP